MYVRALAGKEKALGRDHSSTLITVNNLGTLYRDQGKLEKAEQMYMRALAGFEKSLGRDSSSTLTTVNNLGNLYRDQGKLEEAEQMFVRALAGYEKALGRDSSSTLHTVNNLGLLYAYQGKLGKAETALLRVFSTNPDTNIKTPPLSSIHCFAIVLSKIIRVDSSDSQATQTRFARLVQHVYIWGKQNKTLLYWLAKALATMKDENNARIAFLQSMAYWNHGPDDSTNVQCDVCYELVSVRVGFHVCRQCADTDLCDSCMSQYASHGSNLLRCKDHDYFDVVAAVVQAGQSGCNVIQGKVDVWFDKLRDQYPAEAGEQ